MRRSLAIARKELSIYFTTPWAYVVFTAMAALSGVFFLANLNVFKLAKETAVQVGWEQIPPQYKNLTEGVVLPLWGVIFVVTLFVSPLLSMRLFAEERRQKTMELLMTAPIRAHDIVLGKYLGGLGIIGSTLGLTLVFPLLLSLFGHTDTGRTLDWPVVLLGYVGLMFLGAATMAVGMFISSLTESQMLAAILTFAVLLPWMLLDNFSQGLSDPWRSFAGAFSLEKQLMPFLKGVLDLKSVVFFLSVVLFSLLLTHRSVESQRWT